MTAFVHDPGSGQHTRDGHPEHAGRLDAVMAGLTLTGLLARMRQVPSRPASAQELERVHSGQQLTKLANLAADGGGMLDGDTYCCGDSWGVAQSVAGSLVDLCREVHDGAAANGLALLRPPAHHATDQEAMGFCLVNQVAVAVAALRAEHPACRVAIVDFDVHHGNGTADIFGLEPQVLYISSHQYPFYPGTGSVHERGAGPGRGATVNIPLPAGVGDQGMMAAYDQVVVPLLDRFAPDFMLVSAGYDAHRDDPVGGLSVSTAGYHYLSRLLIQAASRLCHGRIVFHLEGGYNLTALADCVIDTARALLEPGPPVRPEPAVPAGEPDITGLLVDIRNTHNLAGG